MTEPVKIIAKIISHQLNIGQDRIFIYNDGRELPKDKNLYIVLEINSRPPYANKTEYRVVNGKYSEIQSMNVAEQIIAHVVSKNTEARTRSYEVQLAMGSVYAQQAMEANKMHISRISKCMDASSLEGTDRLNRFDCEINLLVAYEKVSPIDYYDDFPIETGFEG